MSKEVGAERGALGGVDRGIDNATPIVLERLLDCISKDIIPSRVLPLTRTGSY